MIKVLAHWRSTKNQICFLWMLRPWKLEYENDKDYLYTVEFFGTSYMIEFTLVKYWIEFEYTSRKGFKVYKGII